ncbi:transporter C1529.01-like protein 10 [Colletotrichum truncatum]|uniref:Transporter C1529.01-like protein 10 n=1 Tax=Colletotrichum truncatum TaxID=5467 RepID=A0ACC3ZFT0_COLTU|nr:transporter C1529.01-like protein 10 [Colletotrichum truncatum]KAF6801878.1 transporter C1529.01-like protein 10 [Colletotrichum truncatum]
MAKTLEKELTSSHGAAHDITYASIYISLPKTPYDWSTTKKFIHIGLVSSFTFITPLASYFDQASEKTLTKPLRRPPWLTLCFTFWLAMFAPGVPQLMKEFGSTSPTLASFVVSVFVLGFAFGPLVMAPSSELWGRLPVYWVSGAGFVGFNAACARAESLGELIAYRFAAGAFGSAPLSNGGASIADIVRPDKRAAAMAIFALGPLLGPVIGPVIGGLIADAYGWRWVFWTLAIIGSAQTFLMAVLMRETYGPVLEARKTLSSTDSTTSMPLPRSSFRDKTKLLRRGLERPIKLLLFSPVSAVLALYMGVVYGYLYLMFTSIPETFETIYGFTTQTVGLIYLGIGAGSILGLVYFGVASKLDAQKKAAHGQSTDAGILDMQPEDRLRPLRGATPLIPVGLFIYGWTAEYRVHWMAPVAGMALVGFGMVVVFIAVQLYLVDAFDTFAASAVAANAVFRSLAGGVLPMAGLPMYGELGIGWGNSLLGFVALSLILIPWLLIRHGEKLRKNFEPQDL